MIGNTTVKNFETWTVTPDQASQWLTQHSNYRQLKPRRVEAYLRQMRNGEWRQIAPLIFGATGLLLDGQHRLAAAVQYGKPVEFIVIAGADDGSVHVLDNGMARTQGDAIYAEFQDGRRSVAQVIRCMARMPSGGGCAVLFSDITRLYPTYVPVINIVQPWFVSHRRGISQVPVITAFCRALIHHPDKEELMSTMVDEMYSYSFDKSLNAAILTKLLTCGTPNSLRGTSLQADYYLRTARVIEAEINGDKLSRIMRPNYDPFPLPDSMKMEEEAVK